MTIVLDASVALAWKFPRANPTEARQARAVLDALEDRTALVPPLWHIEVANAIVVAQRRGVVTVPEALEFVSRLDDLPIQTDDAAALHKNHLIALARQYGLTAYDAVYLELALRSGTALATLDQTLAGARDRAGLSAF